MELVNCALLLSVCGLARWLHGSWSAPAAAFCGVWVVAAVPAIIVVPEFVSALAVCIVVSFMLASLAGSLLIEMLLKPKETDTAPPSIETPAAPAERRGFDGTAYALLILGLSGFGVVSYYLLTAGFSLSDYARPETWVQLAIKNTIARYTGETEPFAVRLLLALNYGGSLLAGISFAQRVTPGVRIVSTLPVVAGILITLVTTAKAGAMLCILFAYEGWLAVRVGTPHAPRRANWTRRLLLPLAAISLVVGFTGSMALRYGEGEDLGLLFYKMSSYVVGQMPAMSAWLSVDNWSGAPPTMGLYTFAGAYEMLGIAQRAPGLYDPIGLNEWSAESNVYSALRGLISDFSLSAAWAIVAVFSAAAQACWSQVRAGGGWPVATLFLTAFYAFAFWSPIVSVFSYNVVWLAFVVFAMCFWLFERPLRSSRKDGVMPLPTS